MDISELEIPEVPIPARILEEKARALKNQRVVLASAKARRKKSTAAKAAKNSKSIKRKAS
jgi:hypothetical protein